MLSMIPTKLIVAEDRLRGADEKQVAALMESIRDVGILNPITVFQRRVIDRHIFTDGYGLVAGLHRLTAAQRLGMEEVPALIVTLSELKRQIAECDENLCGPKLTSAEEAMFTNRRREAYEAIHGKAKAKGAHAANAAMGNDHDASANLSDAFTEDTARKTGTSVRAVQRNVQRGSKIDAEVLARITGTHLDSGAYMDALKGLTKPEQRAKVDRDLDEARQKEEHAERQKKADDAAVRAAEWLVDTVPSEHVSALIAILESVPSKKLCAELRRYL